jgi:hypothetical protein
MPRMVLDSDTALKVESMIIANNNEYVMLSLRVPRAWFARNRPLLELLMRAAGEAVTEETPS